VKGMRESGRGRMEASTWTGTGLDWAGLSRAWLTVRIAKSSLRPVPDLGISVPYGFSINI
jgi:hypothetical protein